MTFICVTAHRVILGSGRFSILLRQTFPSFDLCKSPLSSHCSQSIVQIEDCCARLHQTSFRQKANIRKIGKSRKEFGGEQDMPLLWGRKRY